MAKKDKPKLELNCTLKRTKNELPEYELTSRYVERPDLSLSYPKIFSSTICDRHYVLTYHIKSLGEEYDSRVIKGVAHTIREADSKLLRIARSELRKFRKALPNYPSSSFVDETAKGR